MRLVDGESDEQSLSNQGVLLQPGDVLVLCSDGLTDLVSDKEILETMLKANGIKAAASSLVDLACERGGHDNVTVVILMMPWDAEKQEWFKRA
jgi:protein phosphatase